MDKARPQCCPEADDVGGVWWEPEGVECLPEANSYKAGWVMIRNCSIPTRSYWLSNVKFCPYCGTKLPDEPAAGVETKDDGTP